MQVTQINRAIQIEPLLEQNKVLIIYGPRQVGKTTLVKQYLKTTSLKHKYFLGDEIEFARDFGSCNLDLIKKMLGKTQLLVIDEAQKIPNIGRALKLVVDNIKDIFVIVTGSSSFELANATSEPLTGRKNVVTLYPISLFELTKNNTAYQLENQLEYYLIYGMYPNILTYESFDDKERRINEITNSYLVKDILEFQKVKGSQVLIDLLKLLAFQIGSEVSSLELGNTLGLDNKTVLRYLDLLEKAFVLFRLDGFSRNLRKEVSKMSKYYFFDLGIRNALISNFNNLSSRNDVGQLWENFALMERVKRNEYKKKSVNYYFWRTYDQQEVDLIEERGGELHGYEFKWKQQKKSAPRDWQKTYPQATYQAISKEQVLSFAGNL